MTSISAHVSDIDTLHSLKLMVVVSEMLRQAGHSAYCGVCVKNSEVKRQKVDNQRPGHLTLVVDSRIRLEFERRLEGLRAT